MIFAGITSNGKTLPVVVPRGVKIDAKVYLNILKKELCLDAKTILKQNLGYLNKTDPLLIKLELFKVGVDVIFQTSSTPKSDHQTHPT